MFWGEFAVIMVRVKNMTMIHAVIFNNALNLYTFLMPGPCKGKSLATFSYAELVAVSSPSSSLSMSSISSILLQLLLPKTSMIVIFSVFSVQKQVQLYLYPVMCLSPEYKNGRIHEYRKQNT